MPEASISQTYIFLYSVLGGIIVAFLYDLFRIKRKAIKTGTVLTYIEDIIYWILVSVIIFLLLYVSNDGEIRGFIFIGTLLGVILYILLLSRIVTKLLILVIKIINKIFRVVFIILYKFIFTPLKFIFSIIFMPIKLILKNIYKLFRRILQKRKNSVVRTNILKKIFKNIRKKI